MSGTLTIAGTQTGIPQGNLQWDLAIPMSSVSETLDLALTSGANTITVPTGANAVIILPPAANTIAVQIGTALTLHKTLPSVVALDSTTLTFVLTSAAPSSGWTVAFV